MQIKNCANRMKVNKPLTVIIITLKYGHICANDISNEQLGFLIAEGESHDAEVRKGPTLKYSSDEIILRSLMMFAGSSFLLQLTR